MKTAAAQDVPNARSFTDRSRTNRVSGLSRGIFRSNSASATGRRRSNASEITMDAAIIAAGAADDNSIVERTSIFCPRPKKGFFYSRAYKEHKEKQKEEELKHASNSDDGSLSVHMAKEILLKRDLSRRKRNSFLRNDSGVNYGATNVTSYLAARVESEKPAVTEVYNHAAALMAGLSKSHMHDIYLVGSDGIPVGGSRFILACYSCVMEDIFFKGRESKTYDKKEQKLVIDYCNSEVLAAAVHHCFGGELPPSFDVGNPNEPVARNLAQLDRLSYKFQLKELRELVYRTGRKLINKRPVLACAIFDELSFRGLGVVDSLKRYALDTMREMPMETLLGGGVQWMKHESVEVIMQDQDLDVDEFYMFKILRAWEAGAESENSDRPAIVRDLSKHIDLKFIAEDLIMTQVKAAGYFEEKELVDAVKMIRESMENRNPHEIERVLVEGAGSDTVNGIYLRVEDEMGMGEEEILFVKEADDGYSDVGLYLYGSKWHIAMCADYSNCFYFCEDDPSRPTSELVPRTGWATMFSGQEPSPNCTYLPNTRAGRHDLEGNILAPNLEEMMDPTIAEKRRSCYFSQQRDDTTEKRRMTLEQMMNLPEDRGDGKEQLYYDA